MIAGALVGKPVLNTVDTTASAEAARRCREAARCCPLLLVLFFRRSLIFSNTKVVVEIHPTQYKNYHKLGIVLFPALQMQPTTLIAIACSSYYLTGRPVTPAGPALVNGCDRELGQLGRRVPRAGACRRSLALLMSSAPARDEGEEEEYLSALADARLAQASLQDAKMRLRQAAERRPAAPPARRLRLRRPAAPPGARTSISRSDAGTLLVEVPAAGINAGTLMTGAFSVAWFSAIVPATASMLATGGGSALFMLPFWLAGGAVAKQAVVDPAKATSLSIGEFAWELRQEAVGLPLSSAAGASEELDGCSVEVAAEVNGVPQHVLRLFSGTRTWSIGGGLSKVELEYVAGEVNAHLATLKK